MTYREKPLAVLATFLGNVGNVRHVIQPKRVTHSPRLYADIRGPRTRKSYDIFLAVSTVSMILIGLCTIIVGHLDNFVTTSSKTNDLAKILGRSKRQYLAVSMILKWLIFVIWPSRPQVWPPRLFSAACGKAWRGGNFPVTRVELLELLELLENSCRL